jgi:hypothetical protein
MFISKKSKLSVEIPPRKIFCRGYKNIWWPFFSLSRSIWQVIGETCWPAIQLGYIPPCPPPPPLPPPPSQTTKEKSFLSRNTIRLMHCKDKMPKIWNKYSQKRNIGASVPISTFMCLWANYTVHIFPRWFCLFCWRKYVDWSSEYINRSRAHECGNCIGLRPRYSQKRNI